ncbi:MAG: hypothetical protein WA635_02100 [Gallionella sp.]
MKSNFKIIVLLASLTGLVAWGGNVYAAACTSIANTAWNQQTTWGGAGVGCVGAPGGIPGAADNATIATNVTLDAARSVTNLTVNLGSTLTLNTFTLTVTGNVNNSGTVTDPVAGANGVLLSTGNAAALSGNGSLTGEARVEVTGNAAVISGDWNFSGTTRLYTNGTTPSITGALNFSGTSQLRAGRTNAGVTVAGSVLTINGTLTSTVASGGGDNFLRLYANSTIIGATGVISAAPSEITYQTNAATLTNNGTVTIQDVVGANAANNWTNAAGSTLNVSGALMATGSLTANAAGNTVNYTGAAQTGEVTTYDNLTISGTGTKTFATTPTVNGVLSMEGTAAAGITVTAGVVTYGANATLQYNKAVADAATSEEWITPFAASGGVIIANTGTITMNTAKVFNASVPLTIQNGATLATANNQLTFGGDYINNGGTLTAGSSPIVIANTMAVQSIAGFTTTGLTSMTKTAGTATLTGNVNGAGLTLNGVGGTLDLGAGLTHTFTGNLTRTNGTLNGGSSTLNIGGTCVGAGGAFTAGTSTVNWNAAGAQTVCQYAYYNLGLGTSGVKTMTGVTTIGNNLNITGTATMTGNASFTVTGALNYASTAGTTTLTAATPISIGTFNQTGAGGTLNDNGNTITVTGTGANTWTKSAGTFTASGTVVFTGGAPQIGVSNFNNLTINVGAGNTATLTGNATPAGNLAVSTGTLDLSTFTANRSGAGGTLTVSNGATLKIGGTNTFPSNYTTRTLGATSTVEYSGTNQSVSAETYGNLTISGSGTKTAAGDITVGSTLSLTAGTFAVGANTLTLNGPTIAGTPTNLSTTSSSNLIFGGASAGVLVPSSVAQLNNLTVNNANGITLSGSTTVNGVLTLTDGIITTGANTLEVASDCTTGIVGASATRYALGNLTLHYPTNAGTTTCTFPIGSAAAYSPATVSMLNVTSTLANSSLTARTDTPDHADTTANSSGVDAARSVNRYWTQTPGGSLTFATYNTTFTFVAGDIDGGAAFANFIIARKSGGIWRYPAMGAKNPTDTTATGMTQAGGFGEFVIGERAFPGILFLTTVAAYSDPVNLLAAPLFIPGSVAEYTVIASNSGGPADYDTTSVTNPIPANTKLYADDIGGAGSGPVLFTQGATSSTLTYNFIALGNAADDLSFSNDGGTTFTATPTFDASGCDNTVPAITHIRVNPKGVFIGGSPNPGFQLTFRVCVQ